MQRHESQKRPDGKRGAQPLAPIELQPIDQIILILLAIFAPSRLRWA